MSTISMKESISQPDGLLKYWGKMYICQQIFPKSAYLDSNQGIEAGKRVFFCVHIEFLFFCFKAKTQSSKIEQVHCGTVHTYSFAINQGNQRNFDPSLLHCKCRLIFMGMKQKIPNRRLKKTEIFNSPNSKYFFANILGIGLWVSRKN